MAAARAEPGPARPRRPRAPRARGPRPGRAAAAPGRPAAAADGARRQRRRRRRGPLAGLPPIIAAPSGLRRVLRGRRRGADQPPPSRPPRIIPATTGPAPPAGVNPIGSLARPGRATVEGRVRAVEIRPVERNSVLAVDVSDSTGDLTALFYGRSHIPGVVCGARVRFRGPWGCGRKAPS